MVCPQESFLQVRERAVWMGLSRVPAFSLGSFTQHSLVTLLHRSPTPLPRSLTNGAVLPGDVSVICLEVFRGLPGTWKALAEEKTFGFRLRGRGAGGAGAVLFGVSGRLWGPFGRPARGF